MAVLRGAGALLLLAAALAGCARDPLQVSPAADQLMVHGILEAGADTVLIQLTEIRATERGASLRTHNVGGAQVELIGGGVAVPLPEVREPSERCMQLPPMDWEPDAAPEPPGCYLAALPRPLRAGERYQLRVTTADGRRVSGATTIPDAPVLLRPADGSRIPGAPTSRAVLETAEAVRLRWRVEPPTAMLVVSTHSEEAFRGATTTPNLLCDAVLEVRFRDRWGQETVDPQRTDSLAQRLVVRGCHDLADPVAHRVEPDSVQVRIRVAAFDTAFVRYLELTRRTTSVRWSEAGVGLEGAAGVFAGTAAAERRVAVVRREAAGVTTAP